MPVLIFDRRKGGPKYLNSGGVGSLNQFLLDNGFTAVESQAQLIANNSGQIQLFRVALTVTIADPATTGSDTTNSIAVTAGDLVSIQHTGTGGTSGVIASVQILA